MTFSLLEKGAEPPGTNAPAIIGPPKKTRLDWDTQDFHKIFSITILDQIGPLYNQIPDHIEPPLF